MNEIDKITTFFSREQLFQAYLDVEAALAKSQAKQKIIPESAAQKITEMALIANLNIDNINQSLDKTGHPLVPLIWELDRVCGPEAGGYIHWGATTQNITQTGKLLLVKQFHQLFLEQILKLLDVLSDLALETKNYALPGRTHGQHAVPATFGYKIAVWIDELIRHFHRFKNW